MQKFFFSLLALFFSIEVTFALDTVSTGIKLDDYGLFKSPERNGLIDLLSFVQSVLVKVVLPLVVVGAFLYIAYELLTAEGNEEKMKKAWKAVTFSALGLVMIALSYAVVAIVSRLSL